MIEITDFIKARLAGEPTYPSTVDSHRQSFSDRRYMTCRERHSVQLVAGDAHLGWMDEPCGWQHGPSAEWRAIEREHSITHANPEHLRRLRTVDGLRRIVELHGDQHECVTHDGSEWPYVGCTTLRLIALRWEDHEDYDPAWRPS